MKTKKLFHKYCSLLLAAVMCLYATNLTVFADDSDSENNTISIETSDTYDLKITDAWNALTETEQNGGYWSSLDDSIASVENGIVTGIQSGDTQIVFSYALDSNQNTTEDILSAQQVTFEEQNILTTLEEDKLQEDTEIEETENEEITTEIEGKEIPVEATNEEIKTETESEEITTEKTEAEVTAEEIDNELINEEDEITDKEIKSEEINIEITDEETEKDEIITEEIQPTDNSIDGNEVQTLMTARSVQMDAAPETITWNITVTSPAAQEISLYDLTEFIHSESFTGGTIVLTQSENQISEIPLTLDVDKTYTIDLNGNTIQDNDVIFCMIAGNVTITNGTLIGNRDIISIDDSSAVNLTVSNCTITTNGGNAIKVGNAADATIYLDNATLTSTGQGDVVYFGDNSKGIINIENYTTLQTNTTYWQDTISCGTDANLTITADDTSAYYVKESCECWLNGKNVKGTVNAYITSQWHGSGDNDWENTENSTGMHYTGNPNNIVVLKLNTANNQITLGGTTYTVDGDLLKATDGSVYRLKITTVFRLAANGNEGINLELETVAQTAGAYARTDNIAYSDGDAELRDHGNSLYTPLVDIVEVTFKDWSKVDGLLGKGTGGDTRSYIPTEDSDTTIDSLITVSLRDKNENKVSIDGIEFSVSIEDAHIILTSDGGTRAVLTPYAIKETSTNNSTGYIYKYHVDFWTVPTLFLTVEKKIDGLKYTDEEFTFVLKDENGEEIDTVSITGEGNDNFREIIYNQEGTYTYTVKEQEGSTDGWVYDDSEYAVTVSISRANEDGSGQLIADIEYEKNGESVKNIIFENSYNPEAVSVVIPIRKIVSGQSAPVDETFTFVLTDGEESQTKTISGAGETSFKLSYTKSGTYTYTITENNNEAAGWTYDSSVWYVTVTVRDFDGKLIAGEPVISNEEAGALYDEIVFHNVYTSNQTVPTSITIPVKKVIIGESTETFEFVLTDKNGDTQTAIITGEGTVNFDSIVYDKAGEYVYTVSEVQGDAENWSYDEAVYQVTVAVTDKNGSLQALITDIEKNDTDQTDEIVFINTYTAPDDTPVNDNPTSDNDEPTTSNRYHSNSSTPVSTPSTTTDPSTETADSAGNTETVTPTDNAETASPTDNTEIVGSTDNTGVIDITDEIIPLQDAPTDLTEDPIDNPNSDKNLEDIPVEFPSETPEITPPNTSEKLPQTGMNWNLVSYCLIAGILCLMIGLFLRKKTD